MSQTPRRLCRYCYLQVPSESSHLCDTIRLEALEFAAKEAETWSTGKLAAAAIRLLKET